MNEVTHLRNDFGLSERLNLCGLNNGFRNDTGLEIGLYSIGADRAVEPDLRDTEWRFFLAEAWVQRHSVLPWHDQGSAARVVTPRLSPLDLCIIVDVHVFIEDVGNFGHVLSAASEHHPQCLHRTPPPHPLDSSVSNISTTFSRSNNITNDNSRSLQLLEEFTFNRLLKGVHVGFTRMKATN